MAAELCACGSGVRYRLCCRPFHRGDAEAPDCQTLVRSRFSAFAVRDVDYLWKTLHPDHADRKGDEESVKRGLRAGAAALNFVKLALLDADQREAGQTSRVLFAAEIYEKGKPRGFIEASDFRHDGTGWRYVGGQTQPLRKTPLTLAEFDDAS